MSTQETELDVSTKSNENINVKMAKQANCQVKFDISVTPKAVAAARVKAIRNINKEISIPGFRKGKAPDHLISERYGSEIQKEWVDLVLNVAFQEAIQLTHIHPLKDGKIKRPVVHECSLEKGAQFSIEFETRPNIPAIDPAQLQLKKIEKSSVTDQQKENALEQLRTQLITYEPVEGRSVEAGDFIDLDVSLLTSSTPQQVINNQRVRVDEKNLPSWIYQKVLGLKAGESVEGETDANEEGSTAAQALPFRATVKAIWNGNMPEVNDELAKKVGLQTLDELHTKINERLEQENEIESDQQQLKLLEDALIEKYPIDLPRSLIETDKQSRLNHYMNQLKQEHNEEYFRQNHQRIDDSMEKSSIRGLQLFFLLHKVAAENRIELNNEEVSQELNRQLALIPSGRNQIDIYDKDNLQNQVYNLAMERKIKQFLLDKATFIEG